MFDLLVVGGGINGAGIARDAALRGLSVCLVEKEDYGWGTSAKSSRLAHGGLRYLEQFEFGLVHEALQERERLLRQAPHLVRPLRFLYPIYPHIAARRVVRAGLWLYDLLSHGKSVPKRDYLKRSEVQRIAPGIRSEGLTGGATYYDGQIDHVERLVAELIWDARRHGADCRNHTTVEELLVETTPRPGGAGPPARRVVGARVRDPDGTRWSVRARAVVNAAGPWVDDVLGALGAGRPAKIRKTKGIHIVVPRFLDVAVLVRAKDGRAFFILPWHDACIIGTTDTDYEGDPGDCAADEEDVAYLVESARAYFPDAPLDRIRYTYAGVRPLVNQEGLTESNVTRKHVLYDHDKKEGVHGLWSIQGGKITTYRSLSEEAVDQVCRALGRDDLAKVHPTRDLPLPGGPRIPWTDFRAEAVRTAETEEHLPGPVAEHLVDTYGARWRQVLACDPEGHERICRPHPHIRAEVTWAVREEQAVTLADVMLRRTTLGLASDGDPAAAGNVLHWMADLLGWDRRERDAQWNAYQEAVRVLRVP